MCAVLLQPRRDLHEARYCTSVVLHELQGSNEGDCVISFLLFEEKREAYGCGHGDGHKTAYLCYL